MTEFDYLLQKPLSARQSRDVARALKKKGYRITIADCRNRSPVALALFCEPMESRRYQREQLILIVARAAQMLPSKVSFVQEDANWANMIIGSAAVQ